MLQPKHHYETLELQNGVPKRQESHNYAVYTPDNPSKLYSPLYESTLKQQDDHVYTVATQSSQYSEACDWLDGKREESNNYSVADDKSQYNVAYESTEPNVRQQSFNEYSVAEDVDQYSVAYEEGESGMRQDISAHSLAGEGNNASSNVYSLANEDCY